MRLSFLALLLAIACSSAPPPKARTASDTAGPPPMSEALRPQLVTAALGATTPDERTMTATTTGDTLRLTRYWTASKGSGTSMIVTGGVNGTGGVTAKPDTVAYTAGQATLILPGARPAAGDSVSLWSCQQAVTATAKGASVCGSIVFHQPAALPVTPPPDSMTVASMSHWPSSLTVQVGMRAKPLCMYAHMADGRVRLMQTVSAGGTFTPLAAVCDSAGRSLFGASYAIRPLPPSLRQLRLASR